MSGTRVAVLVFAVCALIATGCGGSTKPSRTTVALASTTPSTASTASTGIAASAQGEPSAADKPLTRAVLVDKADAICARVNERRATLSLGSQAQIAKAMPGLAAFERTAAAELSALTPPAAMDSDWKTIIHGAEALSRETAAYGEYAKTNNLEAERRLLAAAGKVQARSTRVAHRDGFKACADL